MSGSERLRGGRLIAADKQREADSGKRRKNVRIQLISPAGEIHRNRSGIFKTSLRYAPLTLTTLAALVPPELSAEITIQDEGVQPLDLDFDADVVGISAITGTAPRAYQLADQLRARGQTVVLGGVHPTLLPEEASRHADSVVVGYAEQSWPQLLRDAAARRLQPRYTAAPGRGPYGLEPGGPQPGSPQPGGPQPGGRAAAGRELIGLPMARRDLLHKRRYATINSIEATRGCPHKCDFCVVPTAWRNTYLHRPVAEVIAELKTFEGRNALFIDLSPMEDVHYAKALYRAMIPLRMRWVGLSTTRVAQDAELLDLVARSGCKGLLIGFESISQTTLNQTRKQFHDAGDYAQVVRRLHDKGIGIQGCFVFGFDNDDTEVFQRTVEFVDRTKIDLPRYAVATPFPGTPLYRQLAAEGRLLHRDWSLYDVEHVVFRPRRMSVEQLQEGLYWSWRQSYGWPSLARRMTGAPWSILPLWTSLNLGYRYYARNLPAKIAASQPWTDSDEAPADEEVFTATP